MRSVTNCNSVDSTKWRGLRGSQPEAINSSGFVCIAPQSWLYFRSQIYMEQVIIYKLDR